MNLKKYISISFLIIGIIALNAQGRPKSANLYRQSVQYPKYKFEDPKSSENWADSLLKTLNFRQLVGQTLMVPAWSREQIADPAVISAIEKEEVGGIIFFQGNSLNQCYQLNYYQQLSKIPLLIGIDGEWGLAMRLTNLKKFPFQMTLAASKDPNYCYKVGYAIGQQCRRQGVLINFAPDVDVNINPDNPIIGFRSFGSDPQLISIMAKEISRGMEDAGIYSCAKHFPGHGNTKADSHKELPTVSHTTESLQNELIPFKELISSGVKSVMVGHLKVPLLDTTSELPASLSKIIIKDVLKTQLHFKGLIITDALNMKGISSHYSPEMAGVKALMAGNDILCFPENISGLINLAVQYKDSGWIDSSEIAASVRKILIAKHQLGLIKSKYIESNNIQQDLDKIYTDFTNNVSLPSTVQNHTGNDFARKCITLLNGNGLIPMQQHTDSSMVVITYGSEIPYSALNEIAKYHSYKHLRFDEKTPFDSVAAKNMFRFSKSDKLVVVNTQQPLWGERSRRISPNLANFLNSDSLPKQTIYLHFGNMYALKSIQKKYPTILAYENGDPFQVAAIDGLFGEFGINGELPATISDNWKVNQTSKTPEPTTYFESVAPSSQGFNAKLIPELRSICNSIIDKKATEGLQLLVLKNGKSVVDINLGNYDLDSNGTILKKPVTSETVFDLASITKIASTTLAMMKLFELHKFKLHEPIEHFWPEASKYPWGKIWMEDFLTHRSGLPAFLPLTQRILNHSDFSISSFPHIQKDTQWFTSLENRLEGQKIIEPSVNDSLQVSYPNWAIKDTMTLAYAINEKKFTYQIGENAYIESRWCDSAWKWTSQTQPIETQQYKYKYSDLNMIILGKWVEYITGTPLNDYVTNQFYKPMGLTKISYLPLRKGLKPLIATSGVDSVWPRGKIIGIVHDPSAMLTHGVAGNAGLFSNARDLAKIMYMLSNEGEFNDQEYLSNSTIKLFTRTHVNKFYLDNYRGLGFDKPNGYPNHLKSIPNQTLAESKLSQPKEANVFDNAPESLFGHSGFTGTWAWADPEHDLVFVFLSNRTYPTSLNTILSKEGFRGKLLECVYKNLED